MLHMHKTAGAELRGNLGILRGRLRDGAEVGEELFEIHVVFRFLFLSALKLYHIHLGVSPVNFSGVGRGSAGYGSMAIRVDEQCPSTPTVVVQENLIGRAGGLEYLIVTAPVSLSLESL